MKGLTLLFAEAIGQRDEDDPAQALLRVTVASRSDMYGYAELVVGDVLLFHRVRSTHRAGNTAHRVPVMDPYVLHIPLQHITTARYADLTEVPPRGRY